MSVRHGARYAASLRHGAMPVRFVENIIYDRAIDDATGTGTLVVDVPHNPSLLGSRNVEVSLPPASGVLNAIFWHDGRDGTAALHFKDEPYQLGAAVSEVYAPDGSRWGKLLAGSGLGPCESAPQQGQVCVAASSQNLRYPNGMIGRLLVMDQELSLD